MSGAESVHSVLLLVTELEDSLVGGRFGHAAEKSADMIKCKVWDSFRASPCQEEAAGPAAAAAAAQTQQASSLAALQQRLLYVLLQSHFLTGRLVGDPMYETS